MLVREIKLEPSYFLLVFKTQTESRTMEFVRRASVVSLKGRGQSNGEGNEKPTIMVEVGVDDGEIEKHINSSQG